ncbi:uncharacterized protein LOC122964265, partial [Acropora millepora]|uniref:uncharacterized protein LOC122964265 n=1 Tax=Acropora millepora TaxID=45264 RepID=UPI001CF11A6C
TEVSLQFKNDLWTGEVLSVHGSKGEADKNCKSITPDLSVSEAKQSTGCAKRKRKANKKLFADYDISANDQPDDSSDSAEHAENTTNGKPKEESKKFEKQAKKTTPTKKRKTSEEKKQELSLLCQKLNYIEESILVATPERVNEKDTVDGLSESDWSDDDSVDSLNVIPTPKQENPLQHPHFGGKRPKTVRPPLKCINLVCKEEKEKKDDEILRLKEELQMLKEELRKSTEITQISNKKISKENGTGDGLTELVNGSGIWMCPNKLGAAIKDAENKSRTVLVRSLLCGFYDREELLSKTFKELDKGVIEACVDFAMVAKLGDVKPATKSELRQALRCKVNSLKFYSSKPGYFLEYRKTYTGPKKTKDGELEKATAAS